MAGCPQAQSWGGAPATEILPSISHAPPLTLILPTPSRALTPLPAGATLRPGILVGRGGRSCCDMWERGVGAGGRGGMFPPYGGWGIKGRGFSPQALGREGRKSVFLVSPWRDRRRSWGAGALGRRVGEHLMVEGLRALPTAAFPSLWARETCPQPVQTFICCLPLFPVISNCPVCLVCSFLEYISVCLSVGLSLFVTSVSWLLWEEAYWKFSDSPTVYMSVKSVCSWCSGGIPSRDSFLP